MKMFYEKDADTNLIKEKNSNIWLWEPRSCTCS